MVMSDLNYILMSIGPVQSYIAQARRTQDLWMGSRLLSLLAETGIREVPDYSTAVIYPDMQSQLVSIPNRFLFYCPVERTQGVIDDIVNAIHGKWWEIAERTRQHIVGLKPLASDDNADSIVIRTDDDLTDAEKSLGKRTIWTRQIENFLEINYVIVPYEPDYRILIQKLNRRLAARKFLRDFQQQDEPGHKCSVTGEHEALYEKPSGEARLEDVRAFWQIIQRRQRNLAIVSEGERLCALSLVKRMAHEADKDLKIERFPSTSSITSVPFRSEIVARWGEDEENAQALRDVVNSYLWALEQLFKRHKREPRKDLYFHRGDDLNPEVFPADRAKYDEVRDTVLEKFLCLDGDFLYEEGLQLRALETYMRLPKGSLKTIDVEAVHTALESVYKEARHLKETKRMQIAAPSSYYAILAMDGDDMGKTINDFQNAPAHRTFSHQLAEFAGEVPSTVEQDALGRLVYAGGDDVLALLPVRDALRTAKTLHTKFSDIVKGKTISAGIAIVHRTHPLQAAIHAAKTAEEYAKQSPGKDGLGVAVLRRSGETQSFQLKWERQGIDVVGVISRLTKAMQEGNIARQLPYDLQPFLYSLVGDVDPVEHPQHYIPIYEGAREAEFKRIFKRRCKETYRHTHEAQEIREQLQTLAERSKSEGRGWSDVAGAAYLARFMAQEA
jgi:CRISPR-associated protein Cmr2